MPATRLARCTTAGAGKLTERASLTTHNVACAGPRRPILFLAAAKWTEDDGRILSAPRYGVADLAVEDADRIRKRVPGAKEATNIAARCDRNLAHDRLEAGAWQHH